MPELNLKSLIGKLDDTCRKALENGLGLANSQTHSSMELEHWFAKLGEDPNNDLARIFRQFEVNPEKYTAGLVDSLAKMRRGSGRAPSIAPEVLDAVKSAWLLSTIDMGYPKVRSGVLLLAVLSDGQLRNSFLSSARECERIDPSVLKQQFDKIVEGSGEDDEMGTSAVPGSGAGAEGGAGPKVGGKTPNLDQYTIDLTGRAADGKIDPVLGRDAEIRQIIDILLRRRQNNPILTGEAGVGKTAVVEGFANRIAAGDVPPPLQNVSLRTLDLGLLQAGASMKGEFENRLKSVIEEVKSSPKPIILFIDEAHQMIGAGGQQGQGDAANLLKPALARGELRTIAATTWAEYKKYFEKDAALARRFQVVKVDEPSEKTAVIMMRGLTETLEQHHNVSILDEAVDASVRLSARFLSGRQLPDKSVSLLDTACSRVALSQTAEPAEIEFLRRSIETSGTEKRILLAEEAAGGDHKDRIEEIDEHIADSEKKLAEMKARFEKEKELVDRVREIRAKLSSHVKAVKAVAGKDNAEPPSDAVAKEVEAENTPAEGDAKPLSNAEIDQLRGELEKINEELRAMQGDSPLIQACVDSQTIADVISAWTGIPAGRMMADEVQTILNLKMLLGERVVGQDHALEVITKRIQTSRAQMDDPQKPIGVFMMVGSSGVGKTETAVALADLLYGGEKNMVTINMSEYQEAHTVSSLRGSPPGYVGYGEGGVLTEAVRRKPYSVVLLDEVEKAHPDVMEIFFQVFDKGLMEDGEGREIDFKNTVIILTSNVATEQIMSMCADPDTRPEPDGMVAAIRPELEKAFPAALLGRLVVSVYYPLGDDVMKNIIKLKLGKIVRRVKENHGVPLTYDDALVDTVCERCTEVQSGARNVDNILTNTMLPEMSREFLGAIAEGRAVEKIHVGVDDSGDFTYSFT